MDFRLTAEQELLRRSVREFAEAEIRPHVREWDQAQQFPPSLVPQLAALGLIRLGQAKYYAETGVPTIQSARAWISLMISAAGWPIRSNS